MRTGTGTGTETGDGGWGVVGGSGMDDEWSLPVRMRRAGRKVDVDRQECATRKGFNFNF